jgi:pimeloyl-ACP methyl ester carboxylesterase
MIRHTITVMGREVAYWERGPEWDRTIVMLHGFRGNHKGLTDMVQHFDGFRLILPDLPGNGESETLTVPHTMQNYAQWLDEFVGALKLKDYVSWSHSYSSSIALVHAVEGKHKPSALVTVSMAAIRRDWATAIGTLYYQIGRVLPYPLAQKWIASKTIDHASHPWLFMTVTPERRRALVKRGDENLPIMNPRVVTEQYLSTLGTNLETYASKVAVPTLMIAGAKDIIVPLRRLEHLVGLMPDGTLVVMEDQGHLAPIERPAATATISKRFINGLEASRGR